MIEKAFRALNNKLYQLLGKDKTDESGATGLVVLQNKDHFSLHIVVIHALFGVTKDRTDG